MGCAFQGGASCSDGFKLTNTRTVCFSYQNYKAYRYTCTHQGTMSGQTSDPKMCREHGRFDNDCCAIKGTNTCANHYQLEQTQHVCYKNDKLQPTRTIVSSHRLSSSMDEVTY